MLPDVEAILLVGGQGTRLRPLTENTPKPMLPVAGRPLTEHQLAQAHAAGIDHVVLATCYRPEVFEEKFGAGERLGMRLDYVTEETPLGTGGAIRNAATRLDSDTGNVAVLNGDVLTGVDLAALVARHRDTGAAVTLYLHPMEDVRPFGMVPTDAAGRVTAFLEKPQTEEEIVTHDINAGCYVFRRDVIETIPIGRMVSVEREVFPGLLAGGAYLAGYVDPGYWLDLGTPAAFVQGSKDLVTGRVASPALPAPPGEALILPGARVEASARVHGGATVAAGAVVGAGADIDGAVLLSGAHVGAGALVRDSVLGCGARVGARSVVIGAVIGDDAVIGADNELLTGVRLFPGAVLGDAALRFSSDR